MQTCGKHSPRFEGELSRTSDIFIASPALPASDSERKANPRYGGSPLQAVEDSSVDPDSWHTSTVAGQYDGDVDWCREDATAEALEGFRRQPQNPMRPEPVNLRQMVDSAPKMVGKEGDEGKILDEVELPMGLVSSESPDTDRAWMGRRPRRRQGSSPSASEKSFRPRGHHRDDKRETHRRGNAVTLPVIDNSPYVRSTHPSPLRSRSHDPSKAENRNPSPVSSQRGGPGQQHGASHRFSPSPSLPPIQKNRPPTQPHIASTVRVPLSSTGTGQITNLMVPCRERRFRTGQVINHPFLDPLPRRKLEGSPERLLRSSKLSPRKAENIRACFVRPQPVNLNVVFTRSLSPPFNYSLTREQNKRFLSMYTSARIY